jgi:hypothetical protein
MEPVTVTCSSSCTVTHVVQIDLPPFQLDEAGGELIAGAILAVWALAWGFRVLIQTLKHTDGNPTSESDT